MIDEKTVEEESKGTIIKREIFSWIKVLIVSVVIAWFLGNYVIMNAYIPSGSMENTLHVDDKVLGLRFFYKLKQPKRLDIIMFKYPDNEEKDFIKRIIGLPGETVTIRDGKVYINDSNTPLEEDYLKEEPREEDYGPFVVPENSYFVMGDNRNDSLDSRFWKNTYVKKEKILARAICRFWPLKDFEVLKKG